MDPLIKKQLIKERVKKYRQPRTPSPRQIRLLNEYTKHKTRGKAVLAAGYSRTVAEKIPGEIINRALEAVERQHPNDRAKLRGKVGFTREKLFERLNHIIFEAKSLDVSLKAMAPFLAEEGINYTGDGNNTIVPIQVVVDEKPTLEESSIPLESVQFESLDQ